MQFRFARVLPAVTFVLAAALLAGCSKSDSGTSPTPPVTGPTFSFAFPATGTSNRLVFNDVGSWNYRCLPHGGSGMTGTVNVLAGPPIDSAVVQVGAGNALVFNPSTVTIHAGGYVRWVNVSSLTVHTATR
jgi:plastocyanin